MRYLLLSILIILFSTACKDYTYVPPCDAQVAIEVEYESGCSIPCDVLFKASIEGNFTNFIWNFGDGTTSENETVVDHTYTASSTYTITLTVFDENCDNVQLDTSIIVGSPPPEAGFTTSDTLCMLIRDNCSIQFTNQSIGAESYNWLINGVSMSNDADFSHTFTEADTFTVTLQAINSFGEDVISQEIIIRPLNFGIRHYNFDNSNSKNEHVWGLVLGENNEYLVLTNNKEEHYLNRLNILGEDLNVGFSPATDADYNSFNPNSFNKIGNNYFLIGNASNTNDEQGDNTNKDIFLLRTNQAFSNPQTSISTVDNIHSNTPSDEHALLAYDLTNLPNQAGYLIAGSTTSSDGTQIYIQEINHNFSPTQVYTPLGANASGRAYGIHLFDDSFYWLIAEKDGEIFAYILDLTLGEPSIFESLSPTLEVQGTIIDNNGNLLVYGNDNGLGKVLLLEHKDENINILWEDELSDLEIEIGIHDNNGSFLLGGTSLSTDKPGMAIFDVDGNEQFYHIYDSPSISSGKIKAMVALPESGILIGGRAVISGSSRHSFIARTDAKGIIDELN
ncbi:MAG: PKD domain-containing protein [Chitinophagales bacterium]|nr:PKD domain-containing protein [Chitinophagales bacterium]